MGVALRIYNGAPVWIQNAAVTAYGYYLRRRRHGPGFEHVRRQIEDCRSWDQRLIEAYQRTALAEILDESFCNVPYYQDIFRRNSVQRHRISGPEDLQQLPLLPKEIVRQRGPDLISVKAESYWVQHTSGSTGTPVDVHLNGRTYQLVHGLLADYERRNGIARRDLRATFAGRLTQPVERMTPPFWRYNHAERQLLCSSYHLNDDTLPHYAAELSRRQPAEIIGYPSAIATVAEYLVRKGMVGTVRPVVVITNSETVLEWQREVIQRAFQCEVRDYYGSAEAVVFAEQCPRMSYHVNPLLGIAEIVDASGRATHEGSLVCTTLTNTTMPLIRYQIGDSAIRLAEPCGCGSPWPAFAQILGRVDDVIVTPDGRQVGRIDHIFKGLHGIRECQVVQESATLIRLRIVQGEDFHERELLLANIRERLGTDMRVELDFVDSIPRTASGKFQGVVNKLRGGRKAGLSAAHVDGADVRS